MQDKLTASEFKKLMNQGVIKVSGKRLVMPELLPEYIDHIEAMEEVENSIFIPGEVYSSKNSHTIHMRRPKHGESSKWKFNGVSMLPFISSSKSVTEYKKEKLRVYHQHTQRFIEITAGLPFPLKIEFIFHRRTEGIFDYTNMSQIVQDMMVRAGWIVNDDSRHLIPVFNEWKLDRNNPGVRIVVIK